MGAPIITMLKDLDVLNADFTIKVRIVRLWTWPQFRDLTKVYSYEFIIMDEEGNKIEGNALQRHCSQYQHIMRENQCLLIRRPTLANDENPYSVFKTPHKICFVAQTIVTNINESIGSEYGYQFQTFKSLEDKDIPQESTVDVIGAIVKFSPLEITDMPDGKVLKKVKLQLQDLTGNSLDVTLWGAYAVQFDNFQANTQHDNNLVIIVQLGKFKTYIGRPQVSNVYNATKLFINSDIDEITSFKQRFMQKASSKSSTSNSGFRSEISKNPKDEFLKDNDLCNIGNIHDVKQPKYVIMVGTIKGFCIEGQWYYSACKKCRGIVTTRLTYTPKSDGSGDFDETTVLECKGKCNNIITVVPRFKIPIRVQDQTSTVTLTMIKREAFKILRMSARELLDKDEKLSIDGNMPPELNCLINKKYAFKIQVQEYNLETHKEYYSISKLSDDPTIISELEQRLNIAPANGHEQMNVDLSDSTTTANFSVKD